MTIVPAVLFGPTQIGSSAAALYTSPANTTTTVNRVVVTNITGGAVTVTFWIVRSGGSTQNSNIVIGATSGGQSIGAGPAEPYVANALASLVLAPGDAIWAEASTATSLNAVGSGWTQQ